jgi:hypothetical protein
MWVGIKKGIVKSNVERMRLLLRMHQDGMSCTQVAQSLASPSSWIQHNACNVIQMKSFGCLERMF